MFKRGAGILLPISSLPSKYGIGTFGKEAYKFIDFLNASGQKYWQILPVGPVSYGDSPYQSFSSFAGNPYYIDLQMLIDDGLISIKEVESLDFGDNENYIDYEKLFNNRFELLYKIFKRNKNSFNEHVEKFKSENIWVEDYALFMALKYKNNQEMFLNWHEDLIQRNIVAIDNAKKQLSEEIDFWIFLQHLFYKQYFMLKEYANKKGVSIIGDMPIYVALDSADVWANSEMFMLDENKIPQMVAGVPPDDYSEEGQLWGNPLYDWEYMKKDHYKWWCERIKWSFKLYDAVRIDHFRGFDEFYAIPHDSLTAGNGTWLPAKGKELFDLIKLKFGNLNIIAEDLGFITQSVKELINYTGFLKMKVLQFAFDGDEKNPYLPQNYAENSVAYTGTHDNDTLLGWFNNLSDYDKQYVVRSLDLENDLANENLLNENSSENNDISYFIIKKLLSSKSVICIIPIQDYLCLGSYARINVPSTMGSNWRWRLKNDVLTEVLSAKIKNMICVTSKHSRC